MPPSHTAVLDESSISEKELSIIYQLLARKKLPENIFHTNENNSHSITSSIEDHAKWAFEHFYRYPYPNSNPNPPQEEIDLPRIFHGIQHTARTAIFVTIFSNLYRRWGDKDALRLKPEDLKLLQIAALFHDCAREGDGEDLWDAESALFLYCYLIKILKVESSKAKKIAEACANKDIAKEGGKTIYYHIVHDGISAIRFEKKYADVKKNIFQKIIHDADCLDIIRARGNFNSEFLDFYINQIMMSFYEKDKQNLKDEIFNLMIEARSLLDIQGNNFYKKNRELQKEYEGPFSYKKIITDITADTYPMLFNLYGNNTLLSKKELNRFGFYKKNKLDYKPEDQINKIVLTQLLEKGLLFSRGIMRPTKLHQKNDYTDTESHAEIEIRKQSRRKGIPTRTKKENRYMKQGNPNRSVSDLTGWSHPFTDTGYFVIRETKKIKLISYEDAHSGFGKKKEFDLTKIPKGNLKRELNSLHSIMKTEFKYEAYNESIFLHNEIIYDIGPDDLIAIYFTIEPSSMVICELGEFIVNPNTIKLRALYLQDVCYQKTGIRPKIFQYSSTHAYIEEYTVPSDDELIKMWIDVTSSYVNELKMESSSAFACVSVENLKKSATKLSCLDGSNFVSPDILYNDFLKRRIDQEISKHVMKEVNLFVSSRIKRYVDIATASVFDDDEFIFQYFLLIEDNLSLKNQIKDKFLMEIFTRFISIEIKTRSKIKEVFFSIDYFVFFGLCRIAKEFTDIDIEKIYGISHMIVIRALKKMAKLSFLSYPNNILEIFSDIIESLNQVGYSGEIVEEIIDLVSKNIFNFFIGFADTSNYKTIFNYILDLFEIEPSYDMLRKFFENLDHYISHLDCLAIMDFISCKQQIILDLLEFIVKSGQESSLPKFSLDFLIMFKISGNDSLTDNLKNDPVDYPSDKEKEIDFFHNPPALNVLPIQPLPALAPLPPPPLISRSADLFIP